jgi:GAF domain-containing protein
VNRFVIPLGQGIVGYVAESRQPILVANVEENRRYLRAIQDAVGFEARNLVALPIVIRGRVYGVVELLNRVGEENYTPTDLEVLSGICELAGKAIEIRLMLGWAAKSDRSEEAA